MLSALLALSLPLSLPLVSTPFVAAAVAPTALTDPEAQAKLSEAQGAFGSGDFAAAAAAIEAAYLIEPAASLLYPWAQAERKQGNCEIAIELYQRFLDSGPADDIAVAAQGNIDRCNEEIDDAEIIVVDDDTEQAEVDDASQQDEVAEDDFLADEQAETDEQAEIAEESDAETDEAAPTGVVKREDDPPKAKKWFLDPAGGVLSGLGIVGVVGGGALLGVASSNAKKVGDQDTNTDYLDARDGATQRRNGGVAALAIGSTLLVAGVIRYAVVAKKSKRATASLWVDPRGGVAGLVWTGRF